MSQPFSGIPDPGTPSPFRRRFQPGVVQDSARKVQRVMQETFRQGIRAAQRHGQNLWLRGKRNPRTFAIAGGAVALTLVGAYALSASGIGRSLCPPVSETQKGRTTPQFLLLMDPVPHPAARSEVEIHYDVCGLPSGTPYRGRIRLTQQRPKTKKKSASKPKPMVVTFQDEVDGLATRKHQEFELGATKPGVYTLELSVVDNQGRERKRLQKIMVKAQ
jgi:hypothetical protein